jgi:tetratricopeptide (TPR) repeat protein
MDMRISRGLTNLYLIPLSCLCLLAGGCSTSPSAWVERGKKSAAAGKYAEAEIDYLKATQAKTDFGEAWYGLGLTQFKQGHLGDALQSLSRATGLLPSREDVAVTMAETSMAIYLASPARSAPLYQQVVTTSGDLLKRNPNSYDGIRLKGFIAMIDRHYPEAEELLTKADSIKPGQGDVTQALMQCLIRNGQGPEAEKLGMAFLARQKDFIPVYDLLYGYYINNHRDGDAEQLLKNKIAANPGVVLFRLQLARNYLDAKKETELSGVLKRLLDDSKQFPDGRLTVGDFYRANNRLDDALRMFQAGAAQGGKQKAAYQQRTANILVSMGKSAQALSVVEDILKADSANIDARFLRANIRLSNGTPEDFDGAFQELSQLAKEQPKDALIHYTLGRAYLAKSNIDAALAEFQDALRQDPQLLQAKVLAADVSLRRGDFAEATRYSEQIVAQTGGNPAARLLRAEALTGMGNFDQAASEVNLLNSQFPNAIEPKLQLAALRLAQKRYPEAEELYRVLYRANQQDLRPLQGLVGAMIAQQQYDPAIQLLNQEKLKPGAPIAQLDALLADAALRGRKLDVAVQQYSRLSAAAPGSAFDHLRLGDAYLQKGNSQQAISEFEAAKNLNPKDPQSNAMLALALGKAGKSFDSERAYREALALQPENALVKNNLAYLLAEKGGNLDDALRLALEASRQQPANVALSDTLAYIYMKKNLPDSAIQILASATQKDPNQPVYRYHLALALRQKGDKAGARRECEAALASGPGKDDEAKIRALLDSLS